MERGRTREAVCIDVPCGCQQVEEGKERRGGRGASCVSRTGFGVPILNETKRRPQANRQTGSRQRIKIASVQRWRRWVDRLGRHGCVWCWTRGTLFLGGGVCLGPFSIWGLVGSAEQKRSDQNACQCWPGLAIPLRFLTRPSHGPISLVESAGGDGAKNGHPYRPLPNHHRQFLAAGRGPCSRPLVIGQTHRTLDGGSFWPLGFLYSEWSVKTSGNVVKMQVNRPLIFASSLPAEMALIAGE